MIRQLPFSFRSASSRSGYVRLTAVMSSVFAVTSFAFVPSCRAFGTSIQ
jgi:hypothetical protein